MRLGFAVLLALVLSGGLLAAPAEAGPRPIEGYADYQPPRTCHPKPRRGTVILRRWVVKAYGGSLVSGTRACRKKQRPTSEHQVGRAFDWSLDAARKADRRRAQKLLRRITAADRHGRPDAVGRRMGVMYVIWKDRMYPAWTGFRSEPYLSSSCPTRKRCSKTLRHRDHVHVSLSLAGARARTSWYDGRR